MPPSTNRLYSPRGRKCPSAPGKMGMRKWLENLLDNKLCNGLEWKDKHNKIFAIAWQHASSQGFDQSKHADVFRQWAEYRGRAGNKSVKKKKQGSYNSTLKSNFRCALRSLIDCIELENNANGKEVKKRIFRFIDSSHPAYTVRRDKKRGIVDKMKEAVPKSSDENSSIKPKFEAWQDEGNVFCASTHDYERQILPMGAEGKAFQEDDLNYLSSSTNFQSDTDRLQTTTPDLKYDIDENGIVSITLVKKTLNKEKPHGLSETICAESIQSTHNELPNFKALDVKDECEPMIYKNSFLGNGGCVTVKKMPEVTEAIRCHIISSEFMNEYDVMSTLDFDTEFQADGFINLLGASGDNTEFTENFSGVFTQANAILGDYDHNILK